MLKKYLILLISLIYLSKKKKYKKLDIIIFRTIHTTNKK